MSELIGDAEFIRSLGDPQDLGAYVLTIQQLNQKVGDVHPRLSNPAERVTYGDLNASQLTYGEITSREATDESPELPQGAHPYTGDARSRLMLARHHIDHINGYLQSGRSRYHPTTLAGVPVVEFQDRYAGRGGDEHTRWINPTVEGYNWYRGLEISAGDDSSVIIMEPWMMPSSKGGSPFPALYATGDPDPERVREIVAGYCEAQS